MERGILAEAAAWCDRETDSIPEGSYKKLCENSDFDLHWTTVPCEGGHATPSRAAMKPLGTTSWSGMDRWRCTASRSPSTSARSGATCSRSTDATWHSGNTGTCFDPHFPAGPGGARSHETLSRTRNLELFRSGSGPARRQTELVIDRPEARTAPSLNGFGVAEAAVTQGIHCPLVPRCPVPSKSSQPIRRRRRRGHAPVPAHSD